MIPLVIFNSKKLKLLDLKLDLANSVMCHRSELDNPVPCRTMIRFYEEKIEKLLKEIDKMKVS